MNKTGLRCVSILTLAIAGCSSDKPPAETAADKQPAPLVPAGTALVTIEARSESKLSGTARFEPTADGLRVVVHIVDAAPGEHGVHIHEVGDCSAADGSSAGAHYNPEGHDHGRPPDVRHIGDFGNMIVNEDGAGDLEILVPGASLDPTAPGSFLGRSIVVHAQPDDGSQPSGNSGARIGCGVIES
jgi:superoxide dismutase, Cu-Zn family